MFVNSGQIYYTNLLHKPGTNIDEIRNLVQISMILVNCF